jgi:hypothetical protein
MTIIRLFLRSAYNICINPEHEDKNRLTGLNKETRKIRNFAPRKDKEFYVRQVRSHKRKV